MPVMAALSTLLSDARSLSRADQLRLIRQLADDLADAPPPPAAPPPRVPGPRLARPDQAADFVKQVGEAAP